jgi:DNA-binding YbaB/EbfC family protein
MTVTMLASRDFKIVNNNSEVGTMKFPGGLNIQGMMKQAQQMQEKMQREMEELRVSASAGGGVVTVEMRGNHEIISLKIDPEIVKENDIEMLQDMIVAAINEANRKVNEAMKGKLGAMLPPGLGNLF